jgi:hypothetical protein
MPDEKQLPSTEQSLKFMAWDIKKIKESLEVMKDVEGQLKILNKNLESIIQCFRMSMNQKDEAPF